MDNNFKTLFGKCIPNVIEYIKNYIQDNENVDLLIGADSQCYENRITKYGVVIALYTKGKGAHVVCMRETVPIEHNMQMRLMNEVWKSVQVAEFLKNNGLPKPKFIDIDLNPDPKYKSNLMLRQAIGLVEGMGYRVRYKKNGASIQYAANHLVRI
jgi:predicted RNase H-related nuclease YkuK (DUF458 family)